MKKLIICFLIVALLIPNFVIAQETENTLTRAEFSRIVAEMIAWQEVQPRGDWERFWFTDVPIEHWAFGYIYELFIVDAVRGDGNWNFRPYDKILIEEVITILARTVRVNRMDWDDRYHYPSNFPYFYIEVAEKVGLTSGVELTVGEYATLDLVRTLINRTLDTPTFVHTWGAGNFLADGNDGRFLRTLRIRIWDNQPIYFDGTNWIMLDDVTK